MTATARSKRLLVVSSHFPPDRSAGTHRVLRFANDFQRNGWSTAVLTIDPAAYRRSIPVDPELCARVDEGVSVSTTTAFRGLAALLKWRRALTGTGESARVTAGREPTNHAPGANRFVRVRQFTTSLLTFPDDEVGWLVPAVVRGLRLVRQQSIDVVLSSSPPFTCHLIGHALKSLSGIRWVADFRDPWSRTTWSKRGTMKAHRWLEQMTINRADAVILNTPELLDEFSNWYGPTIAAKFHVVTNGYDADILERYAMQRPPQGLPLVLTHAGTLYGKRNPLPLLEALAVCHRDGRFPPGSVRLQLVGKIAGQFDVSAAIRRLGLDGTVVMMPQVPHHVSLEILAGSHVLVVIQPDAALMAPAKLYEYIGLRRPILALADDGAVTRMIRDVHHSLHVAPDDVESIAQALHRLYQQHSTMTGVPVPDRPAIQFDARYQSDLLRRIVDDLATTSALIQRPVSLEP